ncbi:MAG: SDR family oxidoreductase [Oleibacter sp.]|nr:SDR family oxidoreductase [Thalassolituus sp.]
MSNHYKNKSIWITGASGGIGRALAKGLAAQGARLILSAPLMDTEALHSLIAECQNGQEHRAVPFDLTSLDDINRAADEVLSSNSRINILINNAGMTHRSLIMDTDIQIDRILMEINYLGPLALTKRVLPGMVKQGAGQIVVISSVLGLIATPQRSAYIAAKHAMTGFYEALRSEVSAKGIDITMVFPGFVKTDIAKNAFTGSGGRHGKADPGQENAMTPESFAARVIRGVSARKERLMIAGKEKILVYLTRLSPALVSQIVRRIRVT